MKYRSAMFLILLLLTAALSAGSAPLFPAQPTDADLFRTPVFAEPLVPLGGKPSQNENRELATALERFLQRESGDDIAPLLRFLAGHPESPWRASLLLGLGKHQYQAGYFEAALEAWEESWRLARLDETPHGRAVADEAVGELAKLNSHLGRYERIDALLQETEGRDIRGSATEKMVGAREARWFMMNQPDKAFRCGPMALGTILSHMPGGDAQRGKVLKSRSTSQGMSLDQVLGLSKEMGLSMQMGRRDPGAGMPLPAIIHWKAGHYAALVEEKDGILHVQDPTFGEDLWITRKALDSEASGYFLIPAGELQKGWKPVDAGEGAGVWGKGITGSSDPKATRPFDPKAKGQCGPAGGGRTASNRSGGPYSADPSGVNDFGSGSASSGMAIYDFHMLLASLNLEDTPVGYKPPKGYPVYFKAVYNQREAGQPALFNYSNLGPKWTFGWLSYITDDPTNLTKDVTRFLAGGGTVTDYYNSAVSAYRPEAGTSAQLVRTSSSPITYEVRNPDGSKWIYAQANGATASPRKVFLTKMIDPANNALTLAYDTQMRLTSIKDALNRSTVFTYGLTGDVYKITKVTDPFGRSAAFTYTAGGQLAQITDAIGMVSKFTYGPADFITSLETPYGITRFAGKDSAGIRWIQATDPLGDKERVEYNQALYGVPDVESAWPAGLYPNSGVPGHHFMASRNSYYWDKKAMREKPGSGSSAKIYHFIHSQNINMTGSVLESYKAPLENRVWFTYPGQTTINSPRYPDELLMMEAPGMLSTPAKVARVLDDGSTQMTQYAYNAQGNVTQTIDPLGRITKYLYAPNGIDRLSTRQVKGNRNELVDTLTYNAQHLPLTVKGANGQTTTFTYNANGQLLTSKNPLGQITTMAYDANGFLTKVTGPVPSDTTVFTYDAVGRVATVSDSDGFKITFAYDALDRVTKATYPDNSFEQMIYSRLDLAEKRDRLGRWTKYIHNAVRQLQAVQDPLGRTTTMEWCGCGSMESLVDPMGRRTSWERDFQGRVTAKQMPDGSRIQYTYEASTSRLKSMKDPKNQTRNFQYFTDDNLKQESYTGAAIATGTVSYAYDTLFSRPVSMTDAAGLTKYAYNPINAPPALGAGRLASVDGPFANDVIAFSYDALGRALSATVNGVASSVAFDNLGRVKTATNALGAFTYKYVNQTGRLDSLLYPNGQKNKYLYFDKAGDLRLQQIKNLNPAKAILSKFDYTYDDEGQIQTWTRQADAATPTAYGFGYDASNQLLSAVLKSTATGTPVQKQYGYAYDKAGNRLSVQTDALVNTFSYNSLNQLTGHAGGGKMRFEGKLNEAGSVTIDGKAAEVGPGNDFSGYADVRSSKDTVTVVAKDYSNNIRTSKYQVVPAGSAAKTLTYDANGNLTSDGTQTYQWDALDRLVAVVRGTLRSEFSYDGQSRRIRIVEKNGTTVVSDKRFLWVGDVIAEERDGTGGTVTKRYFAQGVQVGTVKYFYTRDHLGSIREMTDNSGVVVARYDYDPFGTRTRISGSLDADFGFTGHYFHGQSGLFLAKYRAYHPFLGRWISRDPIEESGGTNLYAYVKNNAVNRIDPLGLADCIYYTSTHTMVCFSDDGPPVSSDDFVSGNNGPNCSSGDCQNNPAQNHVPNAGPVPEGKYNVGAPTKPGGGRRPLIPDPDNDMMGRSGFQTHGCTDPDNCSDGCIAAKSNTTRDNFNNMMSKDEGNNTIKILP